mmetsp:Transcript_7505/g.11137  ORF Transcript_7505/g.11137 Transcript_7505/m.11137 type:complete len:237 (+) Transcript_7505:60-770(+)
MSDRGSKQYKNNNRRGKKKRQLEHKFPHLTKDDFDKVRGESIEQGSSLVSQLTAYDYEAYYKKSNVYKELSKKKKKHDAYVYEERVADLFDHGLKNTTNTSGDYIAIGHCVSEDLAMGKGIATLFVKYFGGRQELEEQGKKIGEVAILHHEDKQQKIMVFYLITKLRYFHIPSYEGLHSSLLDMKKACQKNNIQQLTLPVIACGLDKLEWKNVKMMINDIFMDIPIHITICRWNPK